MDNNDGEDNNNNDLGNNVPMELLASYENLERLKGVYRVHREIILEKFREIEASAMEARNAGRETADTWYVDTFVQAQETELYKQILDEMLALHEEPVDDGYRKCAYVRFMRVIKEGGYPEYEHMWSGDEKKKKDAA